MIKPVLLLVVTAWLVALLVPRVRTRRKRLLSVQWPIVNGTFLSGTISPFRTGYMGEATNFRLRVEFSHCVGDSKYLGEYIHEFIAEEDAAALLRSLEQGPLYVRHNPLSPSDYAVDPYRDVWVPQSSG